MCNCLLMNVLMSLRRKLLFRWSAQSCGLSQNCFILIPNIEILPYFACHSEKEKRKKKGHLGLTLY